MVYRPLLRWKRGEQTALAHLSDDLKRRTLPLVAITSHSYDPPRGHAVDVNFDARITQDAERLRATWATHRVSVDLGGLDPDAECAQGDHPVGRFFIALGGEVDARPVLRASSDERYVTAVAALGIAPTFRLTPDDLADRHIADVVAGQLDACGVAPEACDAVVDLGYIEALGRSSITARGALLAVPFLANWATVTLASGSFPENLSQYAIGTHVVERIEWGVWGAVNGNTERPVLYGDYTTIHPNPVEEGLDPRMMNPSASVRYTHGESWLLLRGEGTRKRGGRGFAQFQDHADTLVRRPEFRGEAFSFGDERIVRIHRREDRPGNLETWVAIGVNHHIAEIAGQLANLA